MPELTLFGVCQKAIVETGTNHVSLIGVAPGLTIPRPVGGEIPVNAAVALNWTAVSTWIPSPGDENRVYQQRLVIASPSGTLHAETTMLFSVMGGSHSNTVLSEAFPVGEQGRYEVQLSIRDAETEGDWQFLRSYPIIVTHAPPVQEGGGDGQ
jgi:hypothetical protein